MFPSLLIARMFHVAFPLAEIIGTVGAVTLTFGLVYETLRLALRRRASPLALGTAVTAGVFWFFTYASVYRFLGNHTTFVHWHVILITGWAFVTALGLVWITRRPKALDRLSVFLTLAGIMLVLFNGTMILFGA